MTRGTSRDPAGANPFKLSAFVTIDDGMAPDCADASDVLRTPLPLGAPAEEDDGGGTADAATAGRVGAALAGGYVPDPAGP